LILSEFCIKKEAFSGWLEVAINDIGQKCDFEETGCTLLMP
jgi:hypothetical protein